MLHDIGGESSLTKSFARQAKASSTMMVLAVSPVLAERLPSREAVRYMYIIECVEIIEN